MSQDTIEYVGQHRADTYPAEQPDQDQPADDGNSEREPAVGPAPDTTPVDNPDARF